MSLHADALQVLTSWAAPSPAQEALRARYVAHLGAHPDGVRRECRPDHLTASTLVLSADHTHVLLTLHAKARRWFQLGGHCEDADATLAGAALREALEESGLPDLVIAAAPVHLDEHEVPFCGAADAPGGPVHHLDVRYVAVAAKDALHAISEESLDLRWWPVHALPDPDLAGLVEHALAAAQSTSGGPTWAAADHPSR